ncbi:penicillin-binding protein [Bacillus thuringiensis]|uniref:peptidoglycan D,D-transpeptidase FtsI family protein n=1 Tax=Bacillus TaxID=1386 RepID=UPI00136F2B3E|nr:penicillin-binding protein 2 [Bacillus thuringiensis]MYW22391.1 penicillin-binding protein [Bacillus thuringiensis]WLP67014.1 penicillin-binding protein 2 [Bacillus thuringiensis]
MKQLKTLQKNKVFIRLNILFLCIFLSFSAIIIRLGKVQIVDGEGYKNVVEKQENATVSIPVPRGQIFDREGENVVNNTAVRTISYTKGKDITSEEILKIAKKLSKILEIPEEDINRLTETDKKDYWMQLNKEKTKKKITKKDEENLRKQNIEGKEFDKKIDELRRGRVTAEELNELSPQDLKILTIKGRMNSGYKMTPQIIKKNVSEKEYATISESLSDFPGIDATIDWERNYVNGELFRSVLGNITSTEEGLPKENLDYYLVRDYNRNDRIGKSYIEQRYEDVLHGTKAEVKNVTDRKGNVIQTETISKGKSGNNLIMTIDMKLQKAVEEILEKQLKAYKGSEPLLDRAFVVMMNPNTGEILSMAGKKLGKKDGDIEIADYALGTMTSSYELGSTVKGATVLTGFETKAITPGTNFNDVPMKFKGTKEKKSWKDFGIVDDLRALQVSSNVYMFNTALKIAGIDYVPNSSLDIKASAFEKMRYYFGQFGLGVPTGIDLPNETSGIMRKENYQPGFLLDLAIGQYDTYTPLQLAQYVSTIANGGNRLKPQILREIREQTTRKEDVGKIIKSMEPVVLNHVDMKKEYIDRVKEGFRRVFQEGDGTGVSTFKNLPYKPAGKTGTAQTVYGGDDNSVGKDQEGKRVRCYNLTLTGYAPYDKPEVAFSVVVPWITNDKGNKINSIIGKEVLDAYFDLKNNQGKYAN